PARPALLPRRAHGVRVLRQLPQFLSGGIGRSRRHDGPGRGCFPADAEGRHRGGAVSRRHLCSRRRFPRTHDSRSGPLHAEFPEFLGGGNADAAPRRAGSLMVARVERPQPNIFLIDNMVFVPGGTFRMGSDRHYPEEAPAHRVAVDGFWIDRTPVTNAQFGAFVAATGYVTSAERVPLAADYPGTPPEMLQLASLV